MRWKRWGIAFLVIGLAGATSVVGVATLLSHSAKSAMDKMYMPVERITRPEYGLPDLSKTDVSKADRGDQLQVMGSLDELPIRRAKPFTALIIGVDERAHDRGRSDTLMVMAVNPVKASSVLFNIPRDTRTKIEGHGEDKINHAYAFGGVALTIDTVEQFLGVRIDYYVLENMEGFINLVDLFDGVEVNNPYAFDFDGIHLQAGDITLDGVSALAFSRMRYDDPRGDFGRNERQRKVVEALIHKTLSLDGLLHLNEMLDQMSRYTRTDIRFEDAGQLIKDYRGAFGQIDTFELEGQGAMIGGIYYYLIDNKVREAATDRLLEQLGIGETSAGGP